MTLAREARITVHDDAPATEAGIVDAALDSANHAAAPLRDVQPLSCFARLASGEIAGGAIGRTWGKCCELQQVWVEPSCRRNGLGARLVRAFEERARERGCSVFYLETFSFQAPALYRRLGYDVALRIEGFPGGIVKYVMTRNA